MVIGMFNSNGVSDTFNLKKKVTLAESDQPISQQKELFGKDFNSA